MLTCREIIDFLMDYESGDLPAAQRGEFERHIKVCPPCVAFMETYKQTVKLEKECTAADIQELPEDLVRAILASRAQSK